jgi:hypothetical protein
VVLIVENRECYDDMGMRQANLGLDLTTKRARKREFLDEMERVIPRAKIVELITPHAPAGKKGRPPFAVKTILRIHFMHVSIRRVLQAFFTLNRHG